MINKEFLHALLSAPSPSGYENSASNVFADHMNKFATLVKRDNAGNTIYMMGNPEASAKLMLSAHIDEIALQIQHIDDKGFLHFVADGGIDKKVLPGSRVKVLTSTGIIDGVIGKAPIHIEQGEDRDKALKIKDLKIDIGAETKEEAAAIVNIGDIALVYGEPFDIGVNRVAGRGLDDKAGIFVIGEVAELLAKEPPRNLSHLCVYFVACTQEETTATGAIVAAAGIDPDYSIDFDVTFATDDEYVNANEWGDIRLGKGGCIAHGVNNHPHFTRFIKAVCDKNNIPYQEFTAPSHGTNTVYIKQSASNCVTQLLSIPNRNMHTQAEVCDYRDLESLINMTAKTVVALDMENHGGYPR
jgi:endoglucanase